MTIDAEPDFDDTSGTAVDGTVLNDVEVLNRVRVDGSTTVVRGPAERLRRSGWPDDLAALADMLGMAVSIRDSGRLVLVLDVNRAGWAPSTDDHTAGPTAREAHPSRGRGPRRLP